MQGETESPSGGRAIVLSADDRVYAVVNGILSLRGIECD